VGNNQQHPSRGTLSCLQPSIKRRSADSFCEEDDSSCEEDDDFTNILFFSFSLQVSSAAAVLRSVNTFSKG
jgi:hypothetical protein